MAAARKIPQPNQSIQDLINSGNFQCVCCGSFEFEKIIIPHQLMYYKCLYCKNEIS